MRYIVVQVLDYPNEQRSEFNLKLKIFQKMLHKLVF